MLPQRELNVTVMLPVYYRNVKESLNCNMQLNILAIAMVTMPMDIC